jgi:hypothetical protein
MTAVPADDLQSRKAARSRGFLHPWPSFPDAQLRI